MPTPQSSQKRKTLQETVQPKKSKNRNSALHAMRLSIHPAVALVNLEFKGKCNPYCLPNDIFFRFLTLDGEINHSHTRLSIQLSLYASLPHNRALHRLNRP